MNDRWTIEARALFGNPDPPKEVWQKQFDRAEYRLKDYVRIPWQEADHDDGFFWAYYHDLTYQELQPDLFLYAFPMCMARWRWTLMNDRSADNGDSDFHRALVHGRILDRLEPALREAVLAYFADGIFERLDALKSRSDGLWTPWRRLSSMCYVEPFIYRVWPGWWTMQTRGRALEAWSWLCGLLSSESESEFGRAALAEADSDVWERSWQPDNVTWFQRHITPPDLALAASSALLLLEDEIPESEAQVMLRRISSSDFVWARLAELMEDLTTPLQVERTQNWNTPAPD
jgi:hypothetical protein